MRHSAGTGACVRVLCIPGKKKERGGYNTTLMVMCHTWIGSEWLVEGEGIGQPRVDLFALSGAEREGAGACIRPCVAGTAGARGR